MHLSPAELVDIAEGTRADDSAPHLAACEPCRAQLRELREMMMTARDAEVPEPSPLFWDHLSARVHAAVAEESATARRGSHGTRSWTEALMAARAYALVGVAAAVLIATVVSSRVQAPAPLVPAGGMVTLVPPPRASAEVSNDGLDAAAADDPSLMLVASLTDGLDVDGAREAGLASSDSAEHAVTHMSESELRELRRLLTEELARPGA